MDRKRRHRSPFSSPSDREHLDKRGRVLPSRKVCIVCRSMSTDDEYSIIIVDLNSGGGDRFDEFKFTTRNPNLRVDREYFPKLEAFCVLGSRLYAIEGYDGETNPEGKSVFFCEIPSDAENLKLDRSTQRKLRKASSEMHHTKFAPVAIPTPGGRILVFSCVIEFLPGEFELFNPADGSWRVLPDIPKKWGKDMPYNTPCWIDAYSFIDGKSVLMLQTGMGILTLDLQSGGGGWVRTVNFYGASSIPHISGSFLVIGNDLCLNSSWAYDIVDKDIDYVAFNRSFHFPDSSSFGPDYEFRTGAITLLDVANSRDYYFCIVKTGISSDTRYPHLIVDMYCCDLVECRKVLMKYREADRQRKMELNDENDDDDEGRIWKDPALPHSTLVKSFKFRLAQECYSFHPVYVFSIPACTI